MSSKPEETKETQEKEQAKLALEALEGESGLGLAQTRSVYATQGSLQPPFWTHRSPFYFKNLAEDDEFEEFDPAHWNKDAMEEETQQQWMENWDDSLDDEFTKNLREQLQKSSK